MQRPSSDWRMRSQWAPRPAAISTTSRAAPRKTVWRSQTDDHGFSADNTVRLSNTSPSYAQTRSTGPDWFASVFGTDRPPIRSDKGTNAGTWGGGGGGVSDHLIAPRVFAFQTGGDAELYCKRRPRFSSDDLRGVTAAQKDKCRRDADRPEKREGQSACGSNPPKLYVPVAF